MEHSNAGTINDFVGQLPSVEAAEKIARTLKTKVALGMCTEDDYSSSLYELSSAIESDNLQGDSDDWHNFAINFAQRHDTREACKILERGLKQHPNSVDLLGDFLKYGLSCGEEEKCDEYYHKLINMPPVKMTSWRGFDFTIDYLLALFAQKNTQEELDELREHLNARVEQFKKRFPYEEQAYLANAEIFLAYGEDDAAANILKEAMDKFAAPKCCLKYADLMLERGEFDEVIDAAQKGISCSAQEQAGINIAYLVYLLALAKDGKLHSENAYQDEQRVRDIFRDYQFAQKSFDKSRSSYLENLRNRTLLLSMKTGIPYDEAFEDKSDNCE